MRRCRFQRHRSQWLQPRAIHGRLQGTTVSHSTMNTRAPSPVSQRSPTGSQTRTCCSITSTVIISWACLTEGVGALVRFRRKGETLTKKPGTTREATRSDRAPQRTRTGQPERPTGKARRRRPNRADPTSPSLGSWNVMPAVGRKQLYLSVLSAGPSLHGFWVGARGQCTKPCRPLRRHLRALTLPPF